MNVKNENPHWPTLRVTGSDGRIHNHPVLKQEISIGRGKDNDVVLSDHTVSRYHARILKTTEGYLLTDLCSFNGTKVNERSIQSALLQHRDMVSIGLVRMVFLTQEESEPSLSDSLVISSETDFDKGRQHIVESSSVEADAAELPVAADFPGGPEGAHAPRPFPGCRAGRARFPVSGRDLQSGKKQQGPLRALRDQPSAQFDPRLP